VSDRVDAASASDRAR